MSGPASALRPRPRKVLHLIATNFFGGPERQIVGHLRRLDPARYHGVVASFLERGEDSEVLGVARQQGIAWTGVPMAGPFDVRALIELRRRIAGVEADLVCAHGYKSVVMGALAGAGREVRVLAFSRGYTAESPRVAFYERLERIALRFMDGIVCVSEGQRKKLEAYGIRGGRTWVVHNAIAVDDRTPAMAASEKAALREALGIAADALLVVAAGRLSPEKGHRFLVEAMPGVLEKVARAVFLFCGDGQCRAGLEEQAARLGVARHCRFAGFRRDLGEIFRAMDLMVLPSLTEGLPNVVLEAFAAHKPVVATAVGGVPEIVEHGRSGLLVPAGDARALAEAVVGILLSDGAGETMGRAGNERVRRDFTFERQNALLEGIYDEVLLKRGR